MSKSAYALHANTVVTSALGFVFLVVAARLYDQERLGRDLALVAAMMMLASVAELNTGQALPRFLPQLGKRSSRAVVWAYATSSVFALIISVIFVVVAPRFSDSLGFLGTSVGVGVVFVAAVIMWNIFSVQDAVLIAARRATWVPIENSIFGVLKIVLMVFWAHSTIDHGVFYAWALPMAIMVLPITGLLFGVALPRHQRNTEHVKTEPIGERRTVLRFLGLDYLASLLSQLAFTSLPLLVVIVLGSRANASFSIAFNIATAVEQLALNVGLSLTVEGAFDRSVLARLVKHTFVRFGSLLVFFVVGGVILTPLVLWPFGDPYQDTASTALRLLLLGNLPQAVLVIYQAVERVRGNAGRIAWSTFGQMVTTLAAVGLLGNAYGLDGVGWGWVLAHSIMAAIVLPSLVRVMFPKKSESAAAI